MSRTPQPTARQRELSGHPAPSTEARAEPGEQHDDTNHSEPTNSSFVISARFFLSLPELNRNPATDQKHEKEKLSHTRTRPVPKQTATSVPPSTTATSRTRDRFAITAPHFLGRRIPPVPIRTSPRAVPRRPQARWQRGPTRGRPGAEGLRRRSPPAAPAGPGRARQQRAALGGGGSERTKWNSTWHRRRSSPPIWRVPALLFGACDRLQRLSELGLHRAGNLRNRIQERAVISRASLRRPPVSFCPAPLRRFSRSLPLPGRAPPAPTSHLLLRCPGARSGNFGKCGTKAALGPRSRTAAPRRAPKARTAPSGTAGRGGSADAPATSGPRDGTGRDRGLRSAPPCPEDGRSGKAYRAGSLSIHTYKNIHASVYGCIIYNSLSAAGIPSSDELLKNKKNKTKKPACGTKINPTLKRNFSVHMSKIYLSQTVHNGVKT